MMGPAVAGWEVYRRESLLLGVSTNLNPRDGWTREATALAEMCDKEGTDPLSTSRRGKMRDTYIHLSWDPVSGL